MYALVNKKMDNDLKVTVPEHSKCLLSMCISVCGGVHASVYG